jgi:cell division protease FtsH
LNQLAILLGGRSAEEIAVGEISTGAQNDLQRVTDVARAMVTEWGMSEKLGMVNYDQNRRGRFLDLGVPSERGLYSEETARLIDEEVKQIISGAHDVARRILRENRDILERVTRYLLEKEVMEGDELRAMFAAPRAVNL